MLDTDGLISFARDIVRIPSLSGEEGLVARRIEAEMVALGFDRVWTDGVGNVVGVVEGAQPGPTIVFDAHTDTVGVSPGVPWELDPFSGEVRGGALHGRGAADMKGALAAMIHGVIGLDRAELKGKAVVSASVMEEVLEGVALEKVIAQTGADFVVIGEASDLQIVRGGARAGGDPPDDDGAAFALVGAADGAQRGAGYDAGDRGGGGSGAGRARADGPGDLCAYGYHQRAVPGALGDPQHLPGDL